MNLVKYEKINTTKIFFNCDRNCLVFTVSSINNFFFKVIIFGLCKYDFLDREKTASTFQTFLSNTFQ